jgi:hypothetical protein
MKFPVMDVYLNYKWFLVQKSNANDSKFFAKTINIGEQVYLRSTTTNGKVTELASITKDQITKGICVSAEIVTMAIEIII